MSRGFVKEDDQEETPIIPPRAALPDGVTNYVTAFGLDQLRKEREDLEQQITDLSETDERERRRALALLNGKLNLLLKRIQSARLLQKIDDIEEVRFGAQVTYTINTAPQPIKISLVGVDEADIKQGKIAFVAPIAKILTGKKVGETAQLNLGGETRTVKVMAINYPQVEEV